MALNQQKVAELKAFVELVKKDPQVLHSPELSFFKSYLESMNADLPPQVGEAAGKEEKEAAEKENEQPQQQTFGEESSNSEEDEEDEEDDDAEPQEADEHDPEVIQPEDEDLPGLAPEGEVEHTDEQLEKIASLKEKAASLLEEGKVKEAADVYTEVLQMGNPTAMLYTRRADLMLKLRRPMATIQDCEAALKLNPDNAKAYKIRGKAYRTLGLWEKAHNDLETGQKLDYDDELWEMQKLVDKRFKVIEERRRSQQRKAEEKARKQREKEIKRRRAAAQRRYEEEKKREAEFSAADGMGGFPGGMGGFPGGMPGCFPGDMGGMPGGMGGMPGGMGGMPGGMGGMPGGMGGMPGGMGGMPGGGGGLPGNLGALFSDPELQELMQNPKVMEAMGAMGKDPASFTKYLNDPEVRKAFEKLSAKMPGMAGGMGMGGAAKSDGL